MSLIDTPNLDLLQRFLDLASYRQALVANNLANIDTPGYQTRDILFREEMNRAENGIPEDAMHPIALRVPGLISRPDGNNVSLDREGLLLLETQLQYHTATELIRTEFQILQEAITGGGTTA